MGGVKNFIRDAADDPADRAGTALDRHDDEIRLFIPRLGGNGRARMGILQRQGSPVVDPVCQALGPGFQVLLRLVASPLMMLVTATFGSG